VPRESRQLIFLWHLHQPYYGLPGREAFLLPWVRLHATKSYYDMARMLEEHPSIKATVNFSGALLKQLREYVEDGRRDTWWEMTRAPADSLDAHDRLFLLKNFFSIDWERCIEPHPRYRELLERRGRGPVLADPSAFSVADMRDLQVWFNLAWFGFAARDERFIVQELIRKGRGYTESEKEALLEQQIDVMALIEPLYRELHARGQVEVSVTPMYHPILPLIIDTDEAAVATPDRPRPGRLRAREDAVQHVDDARTVAREFFGIDVNGMWPAEGSVSPEAYAIFAEENVSWIATDEEVLRHSRGAAWNRDRDLYKPWQLGDGPVIFFRDHGISDQIGFVYSKNPHDVAVGDFVRRVEGCSEGSVVSVILDGENPWEHFPNDGHEFLEALYLALENSNTITTTTPSEWLDENGKKAGRLEHLHSGSWINGNYQIWIGHPDENRGWDLLRHTRDDLHEWLSTGGRDPDVVAEAFEALYVAEGSDWFWWYGDDFQTPHDVDFDRLFRENLKAIYAIIGEVPPSVLSDPIVTEQHTPVALTKPTGLIRPQIDGRSDYYYEWAGAGEYVNRGGRGSMFENSRAIQMIQIGFDLENIYLRIEPGPDLPDLMQAVFRVTIATPRATFDVALKPDGGEVTCASPATSEDVVAHAVDTCVESAISFDSLLLQPGEDFRIAVALLLDEVEQERHPGQGAFHLTVPDETFEGRNWIV
jgi:alpha-amylase/alpha-mannosidase (GH57 family)